MAGLWFSLGTTVSSTNKTDCHNITEILLKVALNTINLNLKPFWDLLNAPLANILALHPIGKMF